MANPQDLTVEEKLKALYQLQKIDSKINEINTMRGELPMEVKDLEDEMHGINTRISNLISEIDEYKKRVSDNQAAIKEGKTLIDRYEKQKNNVKNSREFDALNKEIELQTLEIQLAEKKIRDANNEITSKQSYLEQSKLLIERLEKDLVLKKEELTRISAETEKEEADLRVKSEKAAKNIEERLLKAYYRIRNTYKNGMAVVMIDREACGGCFAKVPPQRQMIVKQRKKVIVCEHCGRILVDADIDA
ncbi:MAG: hypothetical protein IPL35_03880 [Sphingobacteriales bacterium]|nr:hypothetical protein [Sphingobacteriales bacterium]